MRWSNIRMHYGLASATVVSLSLMAGDLRAHAPTAPPLSAVTIRGTWEAIVPELPRLYVLEIRSVEEGRVRVVVSTGPGTPVSIAFRATSARIDNGRFTMHGKGDGPDREFSIEATLSGTALDDTGSMEGTVTIARGTAPNEANGRKLTFVKRTDGLIHWLSRTRAQAEQLLNGRQ
jgi:hypothetical protein